ncbi:hypothetical protein Pcinc_012560 [Petrolisthes cinctipes]|uniref:Uncharacterized protein n=1 Tax=Petrolisthes cinctipes TaxID=88211 RepID=A0AAE1G0G7_PETCI|nr:hypothetical protein Pcinc_012560 [Petrolisthes cinctipes]
MEGGGERIGRRWREVWEVERGVEGGGERGVGGGREDDPSSGKVYKERNRPTVPPCCENISCWLGKTNPFRLGAALLNHQQHNITSTNASNHQQHNITNTSQITINTISRTPHKSPKPQITNTISPTPRKSPATQ